MLERLVGQTFYCFLYAYSDYNQIAVGPIDQENTAYLHVHLEYLHTDKCLSDYVMHQQLFRDAC